MSSDGVPYGTCPECGYLMLPVPALSPCGHDQTPVVHPLHETGVVYSWSRVHLGEGTTLMAMVDFFGGDLRVTAPVLTDYEVGFGDELEIVPGHDTAYAFRRPERGGEAEDRDA